MFNLAEIFYILSIEIVSCYMYFKPKPFSLAAMLKQSFPAIIILLLVQQSLSQNSSSSPSIYGVRWFLGEHFTFSTAEASDNNQYFVLMFNSNSPIDGQLYVKIHQNRFACSTSQLQTQQVTIHHPEITNASNDTDDVVVKTYLHKCVVGNIRTIDSDLTITTATYAVMLENLYITQNSSPTIDKYTHKTIFSGSFRLPYYESSFQAVVIGDWGQLTEIGKKKGYVDPMQCLLKKIQENSNIVMVIFTGDIAYDLQGPKYESMLTYLQPVTSRIVFFATPGNHDTLYHADTFVLYTQSFYTPQWRSYFNYFNKVRIGKVLLISYSPEREAYDYSKADRLEKNLTSVFEKQFPAETIDSIRSHYLPIVFSHYPIYCSNIYDDVDSCQNNERRFSAYRSFFDRIDMKLYFSGHLHLYERTHPICRNGTFLAKKDGNYDMSCPLYVIEGSGGNDRYIQTTDDYPLKNFSASLAYNTGFGILTIESTAESSYPDKVRFEHISAGRCVGVDRFAMTNTAKIAVIDAPDSGQSYMKKVILKTAFILALTIGLICLGLFVRRKYSARGGAQANQQTNADHHVEMVEQNFQGPEQSNKAQNSAS